MKILFGNVTTIDGEGCAYPGLKWLELGEHTEDVEASRDIKNIFIVLNNDRFRLPKILKDAPWDCGYDKGPYYSFMGFYIPCPPHELSNEQMKKLNDIRNYIVQSPWAAFWDRLKLRLSDPSLYRLNTEVEKQYRPHLRQSFDKARKINQKVKDFMADVIRQNLHDDIGVLIEVGGGSVRKGSLLPSFQNAVETVLIEVDDRHIDEARRKNIHAFHADQFDIIKQSIQWKGDAAIVAPFVFHFGLADNFFETASGYIRDRGFLLANLLHISPERKEMLLNKAAAAGFHVSCVDDFRFIDEHQFACMAKNEAGAEDIARYISCSLKNI